MCASVRFDRTHGKLCYGDASKLRQMVIKTMTKSLRRRQRCLWQPARRWWWNYVAYTIVIRSKINIHVDSIDLEAQTKQQQQQQQQQMLLLWQRKNQSQPQCQYHHHNHKQTDIQTRQWTMGIALQKTQAEKNGTEFGQWRIEWVDF